jgi:hypothetical protein
MLILGYNVYNWPLLAAIEVSDVYYSASMLNIDNVERKAYLDRDCHFLGILVCRLLLFFNNDIVGPMGFMIRDRPIDVPSQWYHCYRFFWGGVLLNMISLRAGVISVLILFLYSVRDIWKED